MTVASRRVRMADVVVDFTVHGLLDAVDLPSDPIHALELLCAGCISTEDAPEVRCTVQTGADEAPPIAGDVSFFHGGVRVRRTDSGWVFRDLRCWVEVNLKARSIGAHIPPGKHHLSGFFRTTVFVALVLQLRELARFHLHAGLVARGADVWLIVGPSGSGKSTTTLSLARAGFQPLADDAVFLTTDGAFPLARPFHVTPKTLAAFPALVAMSRTDIGKYEVVVASASAAPVHPTAIVFLAGPAAATRIERLEPVDALGFLIESSALVIVDGAAQVDEHLRVLAQWVAVTPAVLLHAGPDWLKRADDARLRSTLER